jgi:small-conductance mechanosensitive channel
MATIGLLAVVLAAVTGLILTRPSANSGITTQARGRRPPLVDERPLQSARAMAALASDPDQQRLAQQALRLADHEVDLAFADALRDATEHPVPPKPETRELFARVNNAQAAVKADQDRLDQLKMQLEAAKPDRRDNLQQQIDLTQAQLELDQDELDEAKLALVRSGVDPLSRIQRQFNRHEATQHENDAHPQSTNNAEVKYRADSLIAQAIAWQSLQEKKSRLKQARDEAAEIENKLKQDHDQLANQVKSEEAGKQAAAQQAATQLSSNPKDTSSSETTKAAITSLHQISVNQKDLADLNRRIQDQQDLQNTYASWIDLVKAHQRTALHGIIQSLLLIALILLAVYIAGRIIDHFIIDVKHEWTRLRTLRVVIRFAIQAVGVLLMLFVLFGFPNQMPTILGLAGAGLTVTLKDFIVAFVGWFVLMGRHGIRVGDWVEINGVVGEVVEINLLRTVLLETGNWTDTGHPTGRKVAFVNSYAIEGHFFNFSTSGQWLWDEIEIIVPSDQNPYPIVDDIHKLVEKDTQANAQAAEQEWQRAMGHYRDVQAVSAAPAINLRPTTAGVEVHVRYITRARERFATKTRLYQALVELLHHSRKVGA